MCALLVWSQFCKSFKNLQKENHRLKLINVCRKAPEDTNEEGNNNV